MPINGTAPEQCRFVDRSLRPLLFTAWPQAHHCLSSVPNMPQGIWRLRRTNLVSNHRAHSAPLALRANSQTKSSLLSPPAFFIKRERRRTWWLTETRLNTDSWESSGSYHTNASCRSMTKLPACLRICLVDSFSCCLRTALAARSLGSWSAAAGAGRGAAGRAADKSSAAMPSDIAKQPARSRKDASQVSGKGCGSRSSSVTAHHGFAAPKIWAHELHGSMLQSNGP